MISRWARKWFGKLLKPFLIALDKLDVHPNYLSVAGLIVFVASGLFLASGNDVGSVFLIIVGGLLDSIDGEYARAVNRQSNLGAFVDSICDHYGDLSIYLGLLWRYSINFQKIEIFLIFLALFGSVFGSHVRSRAGMIGIDLKNVGFFTRFERLFILIMGILLHQMTLGLLVLAIINNFNAIQRIKKVFDLSPK